MRGRQAAFSIRFPKGPREHRCGFPSSLPLQRNLGGPTGKSPRNLRKNLHMARYFPNLRLYCFRSGRAGGPPPLPEPMKTLSKANENPEQSE